jgi:hypothetical protein
MNNKEILLDFFFSELYNSAVKYIMISQIGYRMTCIGEKKVGFPCQKLICKLSQLKKVIG